MLDTVTPRQERRIRRLIAPFLPKNSQRRSYVIGGLEGLFVSDEMRRLGVQRLHIAELSKRKLVLALDIAPRQLQAGIVARMGLEVHITKSDFYLKEGHIYLNDNGYLGSHPASKNQIEEVLKDYSSRVLIISDMNMEDTLINISPLTASGYSPIGDLAIIKSHLIDPLALIQLELPGPDNKQLIRAICEQLFYEMGKKYSIKKGEMSIEKDVEIVPGVSDEKQAILGFPVTFKENRLQSDRGFFSVEWGYKALVALPRPPFYDGESEPSLKFKIELPPIEGILQGNA